MTAKKFIEYYNKKNPNPYKGKNQDLMIRFAQYHVRLALSSALVRATQEGNRYDGYVFNPKDIINSYPEENIK